MAINIFKLVGSVFVDTDEANKSISKTDKSAEGLGNRFVKGVSTAAKWGAGIAVAAGTMAIAVGTALVGMAEDTREYRGEMGKLNTAFENANLSSDNAKSTYQALQAVLGDTGQAVEASSFLAKLADNEKELSTWTDICTGVYAEFGASLPIEGLAEAANETANTGVLTGGLVDALVWAGVQEDDFNAKLASCNDEQERQTLIMDTLNGLYETSAENYKQNNADVLAANAATEKITEATAKMGAIIEPVITTAKTAYAGFLEKMTPVAEYVINTMMPAVSNLATLGFEKLQVAVEYVKPMMDTFVGSMQQANDALMAGVQWARQHQGIMITLGIAVGTLGVAILAYNAAMIARNVLDGIATVQITAMYIAEGIYNTVTGIAAGVTTAFGTAMAFLTSPITLVILAIGAIIATIVLLVKNWDTVKEAAIAFGEKVSDTFAKMKEAVTEQIEQMKEKVTAVFNTIKETMGMVLGAATDVVKEKLSNIKNAYEENGGGLKGIAAGYMEALKGYYSAGFDFIDNLTGGKLSAMLSTFTNKMAEIKETVVNAVNRIKETMVNAFNNAKNSVYSIFSSIRNTVSDKINSAKSAVSSAVENIRSSIVNKFLSAKSSAIGIFNDIKDTISDKINTAKDTVSSAIDKIKGFFDFSWSLPRITLPHFSVSGGKAPWGFGGAGSLPSVGVDWYAKGGVMNDPTVFGINPTNGNAMVGGEAGAEAIAPIETLQAYVTNAVRAENNALLAVLRQILQAILDLDDNMADNLVNALVYGTKFEVNGREFARMVKTYA